MSTRQSLSLHVDRHFLPFFKWSDGDLRVKTVNRFKGQSASVVVFCEIDFDELTVVNSRKLFVGMARGQLRIDSVLSDKADQLLAENIQ